MAGGTPGHVEIDFRDLVESAWWKVLMYRHKVDESKKIQSWPKTSIRGDGVEAVMQSCSPHMPKFVFTGNVDEWCKPVTGASFNDGSSVISAKPWAKTLLLHRTMIPDKDALGTAVVVRRRTLIVAPASTLKVSTTTSSHVLQRGSTGSARGG